MAVKCYLRCFKNSHKPILLRDREEFIIGRSCLLNIRDPNCSRHQLSITPDVKNKIAFVKRLGVNPSGVNGFKLLRDEVVPVPDGAYIEVLLDDHLREIKFIDSDSEQDLENYVQVTSKCKRPRSPDGHEEHSCCKKLNTTSDTLNQQKLKPTTEDRFEEMDKDLLYVFTTKDVVSSSKIAAYDLDNTLIKTKSGKVFPKDVDDWQIAFPQVPGKLKQYCKEGYKVVIFTNQAGVSNKKLRIEDFRRKLENVLRRLGVPGQVFISTGKGIYRKPAMGMWDTLLQMKNDDVQIDTANSFYCGDAAGRPKDHSLADRLFAENIGLPFCTPEHHFGGKPELSWKGPSFDAKTLDQNIFLPNLLSDKQEIIVLVGFPGSGKSHLCKTLERQSKGRYKTVCRDVLGSWQKCVTEATKYIKNGQSVIADSTNPDKESRGRWLGLARDCNVQCKCVEMDVQMSHALHNNRFRQLTDTTHSYVADIIFHTYKKKYEKPETSEGFNSVLRIPFIVNFEDSQSKQLYFKHLLEK